jgi:hypothetical protein
MANLDLWHAVEKTDPNHVKAITGKPYSGTSPKPHWIVMKATETFGPCGIGWGFTIEERIEDGALIAPGFYNRMHIAKVKVWYIWGEKRGEVEHIGGTEFSGQRANGKNFTDEDAAKKSVTDALVKALSMIGFAGDIFMGRYDDSKYVQELRNEAKASNATPINPDDITAYCTQFHKQIGLCKNRKDVEEAWKNGATKRGSLHIEPGSDDYERLKGFCKDQIETFPKGDA